jgi:hypothetical protein
MMERSSIPLKVRGRDDVMTVFPWLLARGRLSRTPRHTGHRAWAGANRCSCDRSGPAASSAPAASGNTTALQRRHADVRLDAHGNHVLRHLLAGADAGVKALGGDIGQPVVDADFDLDVRILPQEFYELRPEVSVAPPTATSRRRAWSCCRPCNSRVSDELFPALSHWPRSWRSAI